ncbi:hypothetical protein WSM22_38510 [Cytophagales bacterium WSM2-2]|nr:hypothetical protein WSM22_38510 [Cytophagales bacterium WSM2-2]
MKRSILIYVLLVGVWSNLTAQNQNFRADINKPDYHPPSPEAASLGKYGQYNVSLSTGIPDITIPIYNLKVGGFTLPISISYHAGGIKLTEIASRVGLGWSLNAGGTISQNAMGIPDGFQSRLIPPQTFQPLCETINCAPNADYNLAKDIIDNQSYDTEPDIYTYNFLGFTGKYVITNEGVATLPFTSEITFDDDITDKNGNRYIFGESETSSVIRTCTMATGSQFSGASASYLTKIITTQGDTIQLIYDHEIYSYFQSTSEKKYFRDINATGTDQSCTLPPNVVCKDKNAVYVPRLKQIVSSNGVVINFQYNDLRLDVETNVASPDQYSARALNQITVTEDGVSVSYSLTYEVINSGPGANGVAATGKRMYLKKLVDKDKGVYQFQYTTREHLPARDSYAIDYWGYYNGGTSNTTLIPSYNLVNFIGGGRLTSQAEILSGSLNKIIYPTGGYSSFELEPHKADVSGILGGGLRVKSISNYDADNTVISKKNYKYTSNTNNGPTEDAMAFQYMDILRQRKMNENNGTFYDPSIAQCVFLILSSNTNPLFEGMIPSVQYPVVEVTDSDSTMSGKSIFYYANVDFGSTTPAVQAEGRQDYKIQKEEHYRFVGPNANDFQKVTEKQYTYQGFPNETAFFTYDPNNELNYKQALGFRIKYDLPEQAAGPEVPAFYPAVFSFYHYKYTSIWCFLKSITETSYDNVGRALITTTNFDCENFIHAQQTKSTTTNERGTHTQITRYPQDYINGGIAGSNVPQQWFKGVPVEELTLVNGNLVSGQLNEMTYENSVLKLLKKHVSNLSTPLNDPTNYPASNTHNFSLFPAGNPYREYYRVVSVDSKGNPTEVRSVDGNLSQAIIWNTRKRQALAVIDNASYSSVAYTDFDGTSKGQWKYSNSYDSGAGFNNTTGFNGTSIWRDNLSAGKYRVSVWANGAAPTVSSTGATITPVAGSPFNGNDNWKLYEWTVTLSTTGTVTVTNASGAYLDNARLYPDNSKMVTFNYAPVVGLSFKTDTNNRSEYYNYDASGRLIKIRDDANNIIKSFEYHVVNTNP